MLGAHLFGLLDVSLAGLDLLVTVTVAVVAHKFSQYYIAWKSFPQGKSGSLFRVNQSGSGCQSFDSQ
jgi:hypothetical protein